MALGTNQMTITTGAVFIPTIWSQELQKAREANLVAAKLVMRFDSDVRRKGDTVKIPKISNLTANSKSANTQVTLQSPTETTITLSVNQHYETSFLVEDNLTAKEAYDVMGAYKEKAAYALAKQIDTNVLSLYSSITQTVGTAATPPSDANILRAVQYLDDANAPSKDRFFLMAPSVKNALLQIDKYVSGFYTEGDDRPVISGWFGQRYGLPFYMSTNLPVDGSSNPINLIAHKEVYALAMQKDVSAESQRKTEYLGTLIATQSIWGSVIYRADHGVQVLA